MLNASTLKSLYATSDSITASQKVVGEWNANVFASPYIYGLGTAIYDTPSSTVTGMGRTVITFGIGGNQGTYSGSRRILFKAKGNISGSVTILAEGRDVNGISLGSISTESFVGVTDKWINADFFTFDASVNSLIASIVFTVIPDVGISATVNTSDIRLYRISRYDALNRSICPIQSVFSKRVTGEPFVDKHGTSYSFLTNNANISPHNTAYNSVILEKTGGKDIARNFIPSEYTRFKYLIIDSTVDNKIFCEYEDTFKVNKIVVKASSAHALPTGISLVLNIGGNWVSQTISGTPTFSSEGLLVLYYNGTSWSSTKWATTPKLVDGGLTVGTVSMNGVRVDFSGVSTPYNTGATEVHLVEVSPRLEVDLTNYVKSFTTVKELSNDNIPLPIGISNSNTATVDFSNIPDEILSKNIFPFTNDSTEDSPLKGIISKGTKLKLSTITDSAGTLVETPAGTYYVNSWASNFDLTVSAECYDILKDLSMIQCPIIFQQSISPQKAVSSILDAVGYTDYDYSSLLSLKKYVIPYFWTKREKSALDAIQEVLLPFQISMYCDEYGVINFTSIDTLLSKITSNPDFVLSFDTQTVNSQTYLPNIISYDEQIENQPSNISVGYTIVAPKDTVIGPSGEVRPKSGIEWKAPSETIGYIRLLKDLGQFDTELTYQLVVSGQNPSYIQSWSGYLVIGEEIIGFDGRRWTINGQPQIIKSAEELDFIVSEEMARTGTSVTKTDDGVLCNLKRGMFGTRPQAYTISNTASNSAPFTQLADSSGSRAARTNIISPDSYGAVISPKLSADTKNIILHNTTTNVDHRIYSATFSFSDVTSLPTLGEPLRFGIILAASNSGTSDGRCVELVIRRHTVGGNVVVRSALVTYDLSGTSRLNEKVNTLFDAVYNKKKNKLITKGDYFNSQLNMIGENTLTAILGPGDDRLSVLINGNIISWSEVGSLTTQVIGTTFGAKGSSATIKLPSLKLPTPISKVGKYFGAYNSSSTKLTINSLEAYELAYTDAETTAETLATIITGNQFNLSNKNELESAIKGVMIKDKNKSISFSPKTVARELKIFDFDYQQSPMSSAWITRSAAQITKTAADGSITSVYIPSDAVSFSTFMSDSQRAKFAMINSYTEPVFINADTTSTQAGDVTYISGVPLQPKGRRFIQISNSTSGDSDLRVMSDWIQDENAAKKLLSTIIPASLMKKSKITASIFGNPLLQIGDVVSFSFSQRNIPLKRYVVIGTKLEYNNGIITEVTLRRIEE